MTVLTQEEFENKCIEIMEKIVRIKTCTTKEKALAIAEEMAVNAKKDNADKEVMKIFNKIIEEFTNVSTTDYNILRKQVLSE